LSKDGAESLLKVWAEHDSGQARSVDANPYFAFVKCILPQTLSLFEIAFVLVRLDHVASVIVNANHSIM
jgi:hypothetical protein